MIPQITQNQAIEETKYSSKTFYINLEKNRIEGKIKGLKAVEQSISMMLSTERYANIIFNWEYGASLEKYIGKSYDFIIGDIGREIKEALVIDGRILDVYNFIFTKNNEEIYINFIVNTIYGEINKEVVLDANKTI